MVQSRLKAMSRMESVAEILSDPSLCFSFAAPEPLSAPILQLVGVSFRYPPRAAALTDADAAAPAPSAAPADVPPPAAAPELPAGPELFSNVHLDRALLGSYVPVRVDLDLVALP